MATSKLATRLNTEVWLIGQPIQQIKGCKLPSNGDILRRIVFLTRNEKKKVKESSSIVTKEILYFWKCAGIPTMSDFNIIPKIEKLYLNWRAILKGKGRRSLPQIKKEETFKDNLEDLFDIAHSNALHTIKIEEDKMFLLAQREKNRKGHMSGIDRKQVTLEKRKEQREIAFNNFKKKCEEEQARLTTTVELSFSDNSDVDDENIVNVNVGHYSTSNKRKRGRQNVVNTEIATALDRTQVSDRKAVHILMATAESLGCDTNKIAINRSTIRRNRILIRQQVSNNIKATFKPNCPLTVHWDGKILPDITGNDNVDRLPILVSGGGVNKLLSVPKLKTGTGIAMANVIVETLFDWGITERIQSLSFDTTASNTGHKNGACKLIEDKIGRKLLYLACRHHILEIILENIFVTCYKNPSTGPNIQIFKTFQQEWKNINKNNFQIIEENLADKDEILQFCKKQLTLFHSRNDYRELLELIIIYLGDVPSRGIKFMQPGALHRARWMARAIYAIKICLFKNQFKTTKKVLSGMKRFSLFVVQIYVFYWFKAPCALSAPANDLNLLKQLSSYTDKDIGAAGSLAFLRHQWYLSNLLVCLSFFDPNVSNKIKRDMVISLNTINSEEHLQNRIKINISDSSFTEKTVADFVNKKSIDFFKMLNIPVEFLKIDPENWEKREDYQLGANIVRNMKVTNDFAERGVALMQNYNNILTKNEEQKQYILQVVEDHRRRFPNSQKSTII